LTLLQESHARSRTPGPRKGVFLAPKALAVRAALVALALSMALTTIPGLGTTVRSAPTHVAIETAGAIAVGLTAALLAGRVLSTARLSDVLLGSGLTVLALTTLLFSLVPAIGAAHHRTLTTWAAEGGRLLAAALFISAAIATNRALDRPNTALRRAVLLSAGGLLACAVVAAATTSVLPAIDEPAELPRHLDPSLLSGPTALTVWDLVLAASFATAGIALAIRAEREADTLLGWMAAGLGLFAIARLDYGLVPSQYTEYVYVGDFVGFISFLVLLAGAAIEVLSRQEALAAAAISEERRRLARDLHDGLAQELAYISAHSRRLANGTRSEAGAEELRAAAERALEESRLAISGLSQAADEAPLERSLESAGISAAARAGVEIAFDLDPGIDVPQAVRQALLRVQSQAIVNAAVHGHARRIEVRLRGAPGVRLEIVDDGEGFDLDAPRRPDAIGLVSMRERAEALGADLRIVSRPGTGTRVELVLP
jgi:signal transduction histidine kinase